MSNADKTILVSGATGRQGGGIIKHLLQDGWRIRALTRNTRGRAAQELSQSGVEIVQGDMDDLESLKSAMKGVYGVYSVQDFWTVGARREVKQGKSMADAAREAGVQHFLYSSAGGAERNSGIIHFESKWEVENYIRKLGLLTTILRPAAFMENYYIDVVEIGILKGKLADPIRADKPYQTIAAENIGAFGALAFKRPKDFIGLELEIAGSELTNIQAAEVFSRVLGKRVKFQKLPLPIVRLVLGKEFYQMFRWFNEAGFQADIPSLKRKYPEVHLLSLEEWLIKEGWHKRARRVTPPKD
jgi:uncharacterized protein YbjT (DUF2867 family)